MIEGENEYLKAESFFLVMKKDLNYLAKSIEVLVPTLGSLLDDIMNVAAVFCEIGDFYEVSERSERALMKTSILAMKCAKWLQT